MRGKWMPALVVAVLLAGAPPAVADPPGVRITSGPTGPTRDPAPTFGFASDDPLATFECELDGPGHTTGTFAPCPSPSYTPPGPLDDGAYRFTVRATDVPSGEQSEDSRAFTVDRTPPAAPDVTSTAGGYAFASGEPDATFECRVDTPSGAGTFAPCTSPQTVATPVPGTYVFSVRAVDPAGNIGPATTRQFTTAVIAGPSPAPTPAPAPTASSALTPRFHASVVVRPAGGSVLVRPRGSATYSVLTRSQRLPLGSTVDTRRGSVTLLAAPRAQAAAQKAVFAEGVFRVTQPRAATVLTLTETLAPCGKRATAARTPRTRKLAGKGSGAFRTRGRYSAASGGTRWLVQDTCAGTLTRVLEGLVAVRDQVRHRTVLVRAGKRYLARPHR